MVDKPTATPEVKPPAAPGTPPVRRGPGHRGQDVRDTVAEMAAKAQEISQEAGSKMAAAMKDVVNAAAGIAGFAIESARDLVQYMVRRGQMTQEEADKLIREAEAFQSKRKPGTVKPLAAPAPPARPAPPAMAPRPVQSVPPARPAARPAPAAKSAPAARPAPARPAAKSAKPAAKSAARPAKPAAKAPAKSASRKSVKPAAKGKKR